VYPVGLDGVGEEVVDDFDMLVVFVRELDFEGFDYFVDALPDFLESRVCSRILDSLFSC
jgi:hypothetical protein